MAKILFVEDDPFIADIYQKKFQASGFDVKNVASGKAVLKEVQENKYDIVLLDLVIPEMSGEDVLKELRSGAAYDKNLRVVVFSNLSSTEDRERIIKLGADGFISKTEFTPSQVVDEVNRFLRQFSEKSKNLPKHAAAETAAPVEAPVSNTAKKRILFIEDEAVFVDMFGERLKNDGYDVVAKRDGKAGLDEALQGNYDLVITDAQLPGMEGPELIKKLRASEKGKIGIFLLSASLDNEDMKAMQESKLVEQAFVKTQTTPTELAYAVNDFFKK